MWQKLHTRQILTEDINWELEVDNIESENIELTEDLFNTIQKWTKYDSKILSIARIN